MVLEIEKWATVKQYALLNGVTVQSVYNRINRKTIEYKKIGNTILIKFK